ncbi:tail assembly chaperone [Staphylococcus epidermidis]|uniref:tail assembly chaperone n=1 Tax=Staphylococcus epidermidis TaxID=1282 RepID=UPI00287F6243|nr:tail assembly chaperone [Staphylococcus epidermidis]
MYNGILERDPIAIADFWECATAYLGKNAPKREDIEQTLMEIIDEKQDSIELLQGALQVLIIVVFSNRNHVYSGHK